MSDIVNSFPAETTDLYSSTLHKSFRESYAEDSDAYRMSRTHALWPPFYEKKLLRFHFSHFAEFVPYVVGRPVTVTTEEVSINGVQGHALYGLVRRIESDMDRGTWPKVETKILVEVHTIPDSIIDRRFARLWNNPPHNIVYVQPHGFLRPDYQPVCILAIDDYDDVLDVPQNMVRFLGPDYYAKSIIMSPPYDRLPCSDVYPKKHEGNVVDDRNGDEGMRSENALTSENVAQLTVEELAQKIAESVRLDEDDRVEPWQAVLSPPLVYDTRFLPIDMQQLNGSSVSMRRSYNYNVLIPDY